MNFKALCAGAAVALSSAAFATALPGFDFSYEIGGARQIAPLQIFDDGHNTYLQWATNVAVPAVTVVVDGKPVKAIAGNTPYYVLPVVGSTIEIRGAGGGARATYVGQRGRAPMQLAAQLAERAATPTEGASPARSPVSPKSPPVLNWEITAQDHTLQRALERWAKAGGYDLRWLIRDQILIERGSTYAGPLPDVLAKLAGEIGLQIAIEGKTLSVSEVQK